MTATAPTTFDRDAAARAHAERHLEFDDGVVEIYHLPTNAPPREIRLLEVNRLIGAMTPLEAIDFGVDRDTPDGHTLNVLDITPDQWEAVRGNTLPLPSGWNIEGKQLLGRK